MWTAWLSLQLAQASVVPAPVPPCDPSQMSIKEYHQMVEAVVYGDLDWLPEPACGLRPLRDRFPTLEALGAWLADQPGGPAPWSAAWSLKTRHIRGGGQRARDHKRDVDRLRDAGAFSPHQLSYVADDEEPLERALSWHDRNPCYHYAMSRHGNGATPKQLAEYADRLGPVPLECTLTIEPWMVPPGSVLCPMTVVWTWDIGFRAQGEAPYPCEAKGERPESSRPPKPSRHTSQP